MPAQPDHTSAAAGAASTTGLDLHDLEAQTAPEVMPARVGLVLAAPC